MVVTDPGRGPKSAAASPVSVQLVRPGPTRTCLCRNHSHLTGGVVVNVVVGTADCVRCGAHYGFWPIGASGWVSVRRGGVLGTPDGTCPSEFRRRWLAPPIRPVCR